MGPNDDILIIGGTMVAAEDFARSVGRRPRHFNTMSAATSRRALMGTHRRRVLLVAEHLAGSAENLLLWEELHYSRAEIIRNWPETGQSPTTGVEKS